VTNFVSRSNISCKKLINIMPQKNKNSQQGSFNLYGYVVPIAEKVCTAEACRISQTITQKKMKSEYFRKQARNGKLEIPYSQGILKAEIVDISPSKRRYWRISLIPNTLLPTPA
jgi:hypothetical protein